MNIKNDVDENSLFIQILKAQRRSMSPLARSRKKTLDLGSYAWKYPTNIERQYFVQISKWMKEFTTVATPYIESNYNNWKKEFTFDERRDGYTEELGFLNQTMENIQLDLFDGYPNGDTARQIQAYGYSVNGYNMKQWDKFSRIAIGEAFNLGDPFVAEIVTNWGSTNYGLIKSLSDEYIKKTNLIVSEGVQFGKTGKSIMKDIRDTNKNITGYRSQLIARDQIGKLNAQLTRQRMSDAGIDGYDWITSRDDAVRSSHKQMNGTLNRWDNANVYSKDDGKTWQNRPTDIQGVIPGQEIQCRCEAIPNIDHLLNQLDNEINQEE